MPRYIDADALRQRMYHEAFETDTDMQKWDSGCWIRYKLFENCLESMPTVSPDEVRGVGNWITTRTWEHDGDPYCSNCGFEQPYMRFEKFKFCPSCGAKMEVTDDA